LNKSRGLLSPDFSPLIQELNENGDRQLDYHQNFDDVAQQ
jgi:hypothetical protein